MIELIFKEDALTVSENVRLRHPTFMSNEKLTKNGIITSSSTNEACLGSTAVISCTWFPFMSTMSCGSIDMYVLLRFVPKPTSLLISLRSSIPSLTLISVELTLSV